MTLSCMADSLAQGHGWQKALWWFQFHAATQHFTATSVEMAGCAAINACEKRSKWRTSLEILAVS